MFYFDSYAFAFIAFTFTFTFMLLLSYMFSLCLVLNRLLLFAFASFRELVILFSQGSATLRFFFFWKKSRYTLKIVRFLFIRFR